MYLVSVGLTGIFKAIKAKLFNSTALVACKPQHCQHPIWLRVPSSDIPTFRQVFTYEDYNFEALESPKLIIDAGANIGLTSVYFACKYPDSKIIAIEPEESNYSLLLKNIEPYPNITPLKAALWHKDEEISLTDPGLGNWGFMTESKISNSNNSKKYRHNVEGVTVDNLIKKFNLKKIDILKIDIEGSEKEVFHQTSAWIDKVESMIVELHEGLKPGCYRSFYSGTPGFSSEWHQGENIYLSRGNLKQCSDLH